MTSGGSSSAQGLVVTGWGGESTKLPLVPCPKCGEEILELTCGAQSKVPGAIFFKCRLHERDDPASCPWYLFADKHEKMLVEKGLLHKPDESLPQVDQIRIGIRHMEGHVEANRTELAPLLDDLVSLKNGAVRVDEKLQKLIDIGKFAVLCLVVVTVFVVVGVLIMLVK